MSDENWKRHLIENLNGYPRPWRADERTIYDAQGNRIATCDPLIAAGIVQLWNESSEEPTFKSDVHRYCGAKHHIVGGKGKVHSCIKWYLHVEKHQCRCDFKWEVKPKSN